MPPKKVPKKDPKDPIPPRISREFTAYKDELQATLRDSIKITLSLSKALKPWQSKVGGLPYLPKTMEYPKSRDEAAKPLMFLAQINFEEVPQYLKGYPTKGILQFYINSHDGIFGQDYENPTIQKGFRVLFFEEVLHDESKLIKKCPKDSGIGNGPIAGEKFYAMKFQPQKQYITSSEYRFDNLSIGKSDDDDLIERYYEWSNVVGSGTGHRIGGYAYFTQEEPRKHKEELREYELLFQLDTE